MVLFSAHIRNMHEKIDLSKLPFAENAAFDSYLEQKGANVPARDAQRTADRDHGLGGK